MTRGLLSIASCVDGEFSVLFVTLVLFKLESLRDLSITGEEREEESNATIKRINLSECVHRCASFARD
jgi:hypothetical protein